MNYIDCIECRNKAHSACLGDCSCGRADCEYPLSAPKRLSDGVVAVLRASDTEPFSRANQAVLMILSTLVVDAKDFFVDLSEISMTLQERAWV